MAEMTSTAKEKRSSNQILQGKYRGIGAEDKERFEQLAKSIEKIRNYLKSSPYSHQKLISC